jgi:hypothetical protein
MRDSPWSTCAVGTKNWTVTLRTVVCWAYQRNVRPRCTNMRTWWRQWRGCLAPCSMLRIGWETGLFNSTLQILNLLGHSDRFRTDYIVSEAVWTAAKRWRIHRVKRFQESRTWSLCWVWVMWDAKCLRCVVVAIVTSLFITLLEKYAVVATLVK